jgi:hypothetical protein
MIPTYPLEARVSYLETLMAQLTLNVDRLSVEMREFKDEMTEFKREVRAEIAESRATRQAMNKKWGELSNKMGTLVEDLVAPSLDRIFRSVVGCPDDQLDSLAIRVRRRRLSDSVTQEFDAVATCGDYLLINGTKSRLRPQDLADFAAFLPQVRGFFPEHQDKKTVGAIASLYVDASLVRYGERLGLIVLGFSDGAMEVLNTTPFTPAEF